MFLICSFLIFNFFASVALAQISVVSPKTAVQGKSFYLSIFEDEKDVGQGLVPCRIKEAYASFQGKKIPFYKVNEKYKAIMGTMPECKPGVYPVAVKIIKEDGSVAWDSQKIKIVKGGYETVSFYVKAKKNKASLSKPTLIQDEWAPIEKKLVVKKSDRLWKGRFIKPVPGITTMAYGVREYINDKRRGCHRGQDFRAAIGTPVMAPNDGEVVYAEHTKAFGGTVVLDHGQGIHTIYFHLSKFLKPVGAIVKKGEYFAKTGNSGISSGPHLHWGMSVQNVRVDPMQWIKEDM